IQKMENFLKQADADLEQLDKDIYATPMMNVQLYGEQAKWTEEKKKQIRKERDSLQKKRGQVRAKVHKGTNQLQQLYAQKKAQAVPPKKPPPVAPPVPAKPVAIPATPVDFPKIIMHPATALRYAGEERVGPVLYQFLRTLPPGQQIFIAQKFIERYQGRVDKSIKFIDDLKNALTDLQPGKLRVKKEEALSQAERHYQKHLRDRTDWEDRLKELQFPPKPKPRAPPAQVKKASDIPWFKVEQSRISFRRQPKSSPQGSRKNVPQDDEKQG
ncbi:MAG: hypothetical protein VX432_03715, partial [Candidatus Poribacteria bacterium]|nr:hypothetical protein [Candidatus Poribacteria bacterium]